MTTYTIDMKNIVIGDLPLGRPADFYLEVTCQANPPMVTSLAEDALPKAVHFPETLKLRIRNTALEEKVAVRVKIEHAVSSTLLCYVNIPAPQIIRWAQDDNERLRRVRMEVDFNSVLGGFLQIDSETPPWMLAEFSFSGDIDDYNPWDTTVRGHHPLTGVEYAEYVQKFKEDTPLLDHTGNPILEPPESDLTTLARYRHCAAYSYCCGQVFLFASFVLYSLFHLYLVSCYTRYDRITMARLFNMSMPVSEASLQALEKQCASTFEGTGVAEGQTPCRPTDGQILETCMSTNPVWQNEPRPKAFANFMEQTFGQRVGLTCFNKLDSFGTGPLLQDGDICRLGQQEQVLDLIVYGGLAVALVLLCICRCCCNARIRAHKASLQMERQHKFATIKNTQAAPSTSWF